MATQPSPRQVGKERGQGLYQVNPQVTSFHNLRSAPSLFSPIVGNLEAYDVVEVAQTIRLFGGEASGPEVWAQLCRSSAGPAIWTLQSDVEHVYLRKLLHSGDEEKPPKSWTAAAEQDPFGEAAQSVNFLLAASLGSPDSKKTLESVADHELQLGRESGALKHLEAEACQLRDEALVYEQQLQSRQDKRSETLRNFQRLKQREAWNVACAQIERQTAQAEETLEDAVDDAEALLQAHLLQRARAEEAAAERKKKLGRLGRQLMASAESSAALEDSKLDNQLVEAMTSLETMLGQRYLEGKAQSSSSCDAEQPEGCWSATRQTVSFGGFCAQATHAAPLTVWSIFQTSHQTTCQCQRSKRMGRKSIVQFVTTLAVIGFGQQDSGSCFDEACAAPQARISEERWWESVAMQNFRSSNVMQIGTLDFNKTVTHFRSHSLLIAFYDPRSESFRELQPIIEDTADALAKMTRPIGYIGAVDVTVHSYLAHREAPQLESEWQDPYAGPFRFKRPRFYPMIILRYRDGVAKEYKSQMQALVDERLMSERRRQIEDLATKVVTLEADRREAKSELRATEQKHQAVVSDARAQLTEVEAEHSELRRDIARLQEELAQQRSQEESEMKISMLEAEACKLTELRQSHEMQIESCRQEVSDLRQKLEQLQLQRVRAQQETASAANAARNLSSSLEEAKLQLESSEQQKLLLRERYAKVGEQFEQAMAQSQREAQQLQGQLEAELQRRQQRTRRNRQRLEEVESALQLTEQSIRDQNATLEERQQELRRWRTSMERQDLQPANQMPLSVHEKLLEEQAHHFQERLQALESESRESQTQRTELLQKERKKKLAELKRRQDDATHRVAAAEKQRKMLAASLAEAGSNISRLQQIVDEERASVAALKAQLATSERAAQAEPTTLRPGELRTQLGRLQEEVVGQGGDAEEVALLEQELEETVRRVDCAGGLVLQLESLLRGRLAETRRDWQQLRSDVKQELADFQQLCNRRFEDCLHHFEASVAARQSLSVQRQTLATEIEEVDQQRQRAESQRQQFQSEEAAQEAKRVQLELVLERQQRIMARLLDGAAAALPTANLEQVKERLLAADGLAGPLVDQAISDLKKELERGFLHAATASGEEELDSLGEESLEANQEAAVRRAAAAMASREAEITGELAELKAREGRLEAELQRRQLERQSRQEQRSQRRQELLEEVAQQEDLLRVAEEQATGEVAVARQLEEDLRCQSPESKSMEAAAPLRDQLSRLLSEVSELQGRFAQEALACEETWESRLLQAASAAEAAAEEEEMVLEAEVREAWAKVMSAELSEEAVVREAQQRAELLCHRSSEGRAQLEEARREKQRMTAEYEGLAKQEEQCLNALRHAEQRLSQTEEAEATQAMQLGSRLQELRQRQEQEVSDLKSKHAAEMSRERNLGVVKKKNLLEFLKREMVPKGALQNNTEDLQKLFRNTPGPFVLACGFEGKPQEANFTEVLQATANLLSGEMIFTQANLNLCSSLRADLTSPSVLYIRKSAASTTPPVSASIQSSTSVLLNQEAFVEWLNLQRPVLLKEITPDNSWVFLARREALVIFLVDSKDAADKKSGEALFSEIEVHLEAKYFQLAWADCVEFSEEFGITQCPAFLVVDTEAEDLSQPPYLTWQELLQPTKVNRKAAWSKAASAAERLRLWLEEQTGAIRKRIDGEENNQSSKDDGKNKRSDENVEEIVWANDWYIHVLNVLTKRKTKLSQEGTRFHVVDAVGQRLPLQESLKLRNLQDPNRFPLKFYFQEEEIDDAEPDSSEDFLNDWEDIREGTSTETAYGIYQAILMHMTLLRQSFQDVYGDYLPFDFSSIDRVQELHTHMRLLVSSTEDVEEVLRNKSYRLRVWKSMEKRLSFLEDLEDQNSTEEPKVQGKSGKGTISKSQQKFRIFRNALIEGSGLLREVFRSLFEMLHRKVRDGALGDPRPVLDVPRRAAESLSLEEFIETYAKPGLPVIITGLNVTPKEEWSLEFFRSRCNVSVELSRRNPKSKSWGRLEKAGRLFLADFIDTFTSNATRRKWYLHDWSLPRHCPEAFGPAPFEGFTVPKYFAGDYFQRAGFESYRHSWPSLFVGSNETQSSMHIDSGNTHFMLHLLSGRKEWRFYSARDLINLYMSPVSSRFHYDVFRPDNEKFPLARYAEQFMGIQEAGDTIFIPAANPHAVRNLEDIHGISMNYVDASNVKLSILQRIWEMEGGDVELYTDGTSIIHGLVSEQRHMSFGDWKAQDWKRTTYDLF
eukprot:s92_g46.t1